MPHWLRWLLTLAGRGALVVWVSATIVFFALRLSGTDPVQAVLGGPGSQAGEDAVAAAKEQYGLDLPLWQQYFLLMWRVVTLDLGTSYSRRVPVSDLLTAALPATAILAFASMALAWVLALVVTTAGTTCPQHAGWRGVVGRAGASALRGAGVLASVMPHFWLGALLVAVFASATGWLPATSTPGSLPGLVLPSVTLAIPLAGFLAQLMADSMDQAERAPFATTARARGLGPVGVVAHHTMRHAALPAVALSGWAFGSLLSGAVVVEVLFGRPGLGRLLVDATLVRDVPTVIGAIVVVALIFVVVSALADGVELLLDPRRRV